MIPKELFISTYPDSNEVAKGINLRVDHSLGSKSLSCANVQELHVQFRQCLPLPGSRAFQPSLISLREHNSLPD